MESTYISHMGDDLLVVNAARVSFHKESQEFTYREGVAKGSDEGLLNYLATHGHFTPFTHPQICIREKVPIFVARQRFKHVVGFTYNEVSRRYVDDTPEFYTPDVWRIRPDGSMKQGSGTEKLKTPDFKEGFCINCGAGIVDTKREQGGGQRRKYCSTKCKSSFTNKHRNPYKTTFQNAKGRVEREGKRKWDLDFDTFEFPEYCPYLGVKLDYSYGKGQIKPESPSFDRIDPSKDYVEGNVEIVSNRANSMKNDASKDEQIKMAEAVLLKYKGYVPNYEHSYEGVITKAKELYMDMLAAGYSPEQARMILPQSMYTEYYVTGSLAAWARAYKQRVDPHAQKEIQDLAHTWASIIEPLFPNSWKALTQD